MSFSNAAEQAIMLLIFNASPWANMADNAASAPQTSISTSLHTADPGEGGTMSTSESAYTSYARVDQARTAGGWTSTAGVVSPATNIDFPAGTGGAGTVTHCGAGKTGGGATALHLSGTVTPNIVTGNGVTPRLTTATTFSLD